MMRTQDDPRAAASPPLGLLDLHDFRLDGWLVQPSLDRVTRGDVAIRIRPQLMDVLVCLAARAGRMVTREELLATVWSDRFVVESGLTRCVSELRQTLGDSARQPRIIETIPKRGYRLIADVVSAPEPALAL
jgi:DNA-binding winged helix-turn-helix (wHTH) protein